MNDPKTNPNQPNGAPQLVRDAMAELLRVGITVTRLVGLTAQAEIDLAESAKAASAADGASPLATSLAEAIESDRAAAAAAEARATVVARTEAVARANAQTARAVRRNVLLAERLDRGWARGGADDRHAMARRQIERAANDAIERDAPSAEQPDRADRLTEALADRLDALDALDDIGNRPADAIIRDICRDLGVDPQGLANPQGLGNAQGLGNVLGPDNPFNPAHTTPVVTSRHDALPPAEPAAEAPVTAAGNTPMLPGSQGKTTPWSSPLQNPPPPNARASPPES